MFGVELIACPEQSTGDQFQIARVGHCFRVMSDGGAETAGSLLFIDPCHDCFGDTFISIPANDLLAGCERVGVEQFDIVVKFFPNGCPILECGGDGVSRVREMNVNGNLGAMT